LPADSPEIFMARRYAIGLLALTLVGGYLFLAAGPNGEQIADERTAAETQPRLGRDHPFSA
jgi:hypothetical protein